MKIGSFLFIASSLFLSACGPKFSVADDAYAGAAGMAGESPMGSQNAEIIGSSSGGSTSVDATDSEAGISSEIATGGADSVEPLGSAGEASSEAGSAGSSAGESSVEGTAGSAGSAILETGDAGSAGTVASAGSAGDSAVGGTASGPVDSDEDRYLANASNPLYVDCDDERADVNPGAPEICDGVDNDCDGETDEGLVDCEMMDGSAGSTGAGGASSTGGGSNASTGGVATVSSAGSAGTDSSETGGSGSVVLVEDTVTYSVQFWTDEFYPWESFYFTYLPIESGYEGYFTPGIACDDTVNSLYRECFLENVPDITWQFYAATGIEGAGGYLPGMEYVTGENYPQAFSRVDVYRVDENGAYTAVEFGIALNEAGNGYNFVIHPGGINPDSEDRDGDFVSDADEEAYGADCYINNPTVRPTLTSLDHDFETTLQSELCGATSTEVYVPTSSDTNWPSGARAIDVIALNKDPDLGDLAGELAYIEVWSPYVWTGVCSYEENIGDPLMDFQTVSGWRCPSVPFVRTEHVSFQLTVVQGDDVDQWAAKYSCDGSCDILANRWADGDFRVYGSDGGSPFFALDVGQATLTGLTYTNATRAFMDTTRSIVHVVVPDTW